MRRHRRNESFALTPYSPRFVQTDVGIAGLTVIGVVVNPKTKQPLLACTDGDYVSIRSLEDVGLFDKLGVGYHSENHERATDVTGYPRVHTPDGVKTKGGGYGTALYTALCVGAWQVYEGRARIGMRGDKPGISSAEDDRSRAASRWWEAAVSSGLAERETEEGDDETEEHVSLDVDAEDLERIASGLDEGAHITYVNDVNVDVTKPGEDQIFDFYTFDSAQGHNLVLFGCSVEIPSMPIADQLRFLSTREIESGDAIYECDQAALLALDVRGLAPGFIDLLALAYRGAELGDRAIDDLRYRFEHQLDPEATSPQERLFKNSGEGGLAEVMRARAHVPWDSLADLP